MQFLILYLIKYFETWNSLMVWYYTLLNNLFWYTSIFLFFCNILFNIFRKEQKKKKKKKKKKKNKKKKLKKKNILFYSFI